MVSRVRGVKGFNLVQVLLIALWVAVLIAVVSVLMVTFLDGNFNPLTAIGGAMMVLVCLPLSIVVHRLNPDRDFREVTLGLVIFLVCIITSGVLMYVLPATFAAPWLAPLGQMVWLGAYAALIVPLFFHLNARRQFLDRRLDLLLTMICAMAVVLIGYTVIAENQKLAVNGLNILAFAAFVSLDIILLFLLSKLLLVSLSHVYRYFYAFLFTFFFLDFFSDVLNLFTFLNFTAPADVAYSSPYSLIIYSVAEIFLSVALVLYSSRNINPETVEEVRETLHDTRCMMNDLIRQSPDAICVCDGKGTAVTVNDAFVRIFDLDHDAAIGIWNVFTDSGWIGLSESDLNRARNGNTVALPQAMHPTLDMFLALKIYPTFTSGGKLSGYVVVAEDITERKKIEEERTSLIRQLELEQKRMRETKEQAELYLDLMGHDINNLHQIALGYLEMAQEMTAHGNLRGDFFNQPIKVLQRSAMLIQNVQKLRKLSECEYTDELVDLTRTIHNVCREYEDSSGKRLVLLAGEPAGRYVKANELLHDVFSNLVSNAIKHSNEASLDIIIRIDDVQENGELFYRVRVEDNGPGIPDRFKEKIFNRLHCGDSMAKGMGLGLYLVKSLTDSYNGKVWVEDRVSGDYHKGARFVVLLPAAET